MYLPAGSSARSAGSVCWCEARPSSRRSRPASAPSTRELDPGLVVRVNRLEENLDFWRTVSRLVAGLSGSLSLLALVLASVGVYGVVSYVVSRRLREVGIRMMLGASARDVQALILRQTLRPVAIGVVIGIACGSGRLADSHERAVRRQPRSIRSRSSARRCSCWESRRLRASCRHAGRRGSTR